MTPMDAIAAATGTNARLLRLNRLGTVAECVPQVHSAAPAASRFRERAAWAAVVLLAAVSVLYFRQAEPVDAPETRLDIITAPTSDPASFAISPDGRRIVIMGSDNGAERLLLRPLDSTTAQPLAGTEGARYPF